MIPNQIITGSANPNPNTFSCTHFNDENFFAYSSGRNVYILKGGALRVIQILTGHKSDVTSVAWLNNNSKLLTASSNEIFLYNIVNSNAGSESIDIHNTNTQVQQTFEWERILTIPNPFDITTMCWLNSNSFVVGGDYLCIWRLDFDQIYKQHRLNKQEEQSKLLQQQQLLQQLSSQSSNNQSNQSNQQQQQQQQQQSKNVSSFRDQKLFRKQAWIVWKSDCSQPIHLISCSPDGRLFATVGKCDRMLKVWYQQKKIKKLTVEEEYLQQQLLTSQQQQMEQQQQQQQQERKKGYFKDQFNKLTSKEPKFKLKKDEEENDGSILSNYLLQQLALKKQKKNSRNDYESYSFIYLPHPRSICWISWRMRDPSHHNILLTNCRDGVVRLWQQSLQSNRLQFNVSNIIPAGTESVDWVNCYSPFYLQKNLNNLKGNQQQSNDQNNNNNNNQNNNSNQQKQDEQDDEQDLLTNLKNPILLRQKECQLVKSKPIVDWIIGVKQDGSLILWKLRTDDSTTRQTSSISIWINSPILSPQEVGPNRIVALYQPVSMSDNTPTSITMCVNSFNGAISCRKFFILNQNHTQISSTSPTSRCFGHKSTIKSINVSPASHYLSTVDRQNNTILWQTTDGTKTQSPYFLVDIGTISTSYSLSWSTQANFCFSANKEGILVYHVDPHDNNKPLKFPIGLIDNSTFTFGQHIEEIHVVELQTQLYTDYHIESELFQYFIVGLNSTGERLYVWGVSIEQNQHHHLYQQQQQQQQQQSSRLSSPPPNNTNNMLPFVLTSKLLTVKHFDRESRITCICPTPKGISDKLSLSSLFNEKSNKKQSQTEEEEDYIESTSASPPDSTSTKDVNNQEKSFNDLPSHPICITGSVNGNITVWSISPFDKDGEGDSNEEEDQAIVDDHLNDLDSINISIENESPTTTKQNNTNNNNNNIKWKVIELCSYGAYQQPVESVRPAYYGRFASTPSINSILSNNGVVNPEVHIWELESHTPKLQLEDTIKFYTPEEHQQLIQLQQQSLQPISIQVPTSSMSNLDCHQVEDAISSIPKNGCLFSFAYFADGTTSLAVGYKNLVRVLRKPTDRVIGSYKRPWVETHRYQELSSNCVSVEWGRDRELLVASGNQILVFSKWMKPIDTFMSLFYGHANIETIYHQHSLLTRSLPYYHPKLLTEYMMAGKFEKVEKILIFITKYLMSKFSSLTTTTTPSKKYSSIISDSDDDDEDKDDQEEEQEESSKVDVDLTNVVYLPEIDIEELLYGQEGDNQGKTTSTSESRDNDFGDDLNNFHGGSSSLRRSISIESIGEDKTFTKRQATQLNEILSMIKLANLLGGEQIQLLALADTYGHISEMRGGLDENGSRFLLNVKIFQFLRRSLQPSERPASLSATELLWALHSECQETILQHCFPSDPYWDDLKQLGAGLWIKNPITLKNTIEKLAKTTYMLNKDPSECALYYIALGKKGSLIALHRANKETKQVDFLQQDFTQQKWINLAAKSAYLLQSKHKYDLAASMFLLAGDLKQAINLILQVKGDFQLAYVMARLFEGEGGPTSKMILEETVIPHAKKTNDRNLLSICNWLLKDYEGSLKVLLPTTVIDSSEKRLDGDTTYGFGGLGSPSPSGNTSPILGSINFGRVSSVASFGSLGGGAGGSSSPTPGNQLLKSTKSTISSQIRTSELGPSTLYFFRYLKNHVLLKQVSDEKKKDHPFLRNSIYSYLYSGCSYLAMEHIEEMERSHPKLISDDKQDEKQDINNNNNQQQQKQPEQKQEEKSNFDDLGLDFGGGSSSSYFNSKPKEDDLGLDFGSSSSYFNKPKQDDLGLDFGSSSSYFNKPKEDDLGLDFGSSSSYFNKPKQDDLGLDFGSSSSYFNKPKQDDLGLDFGDTSKPSTLKQSTTIVDKHTQLTSSKSLINKLTREKISIIPIIDLELKAKLILQVLVQNITNFKDSNSWKDNRDKFDHNLMVLSQTYEIDKSIILDRLSTYCTHRQYYKQVVHLYKELGKSANDFLDQTCTSILKSIYRIDDYVQNQRQSEHFINLAIELYSCIEDIKYPSIIILAIYMMLFVASWGYSRFDILKLLFEEKDINYLMSEICKSNSTKYNDKDIRIDDSDQEDDDDDYINDQEKLNKLNQDRSNIKSLQKIFELFCLTKFKKVYDNLIKELVYNPIFDLSHQRIHYWLVNIQSKVLSPPHQIYETFYRKPRNEANGNLLTLVKSLPCFQTQDRMDLWTLLLKDNDNIELLAKTILPEEQLSNLDGKPIIPSQQQSKRIKFEEAIELYKDGDILQSFCIDISSEEPGMVAVATTRGIREFDLKPTNDHSSNRYDDFDMDSVSTSAVGEFLSPTQSRKLRISAKSISSLGSTFKGKQNVFKNAISSLNISKQVDHNIIVQCLESHPTSSFYLSGGIDGSVCLWQYGIPEALAAYQLPTKPRIVRCKFNQSGSKFGACDMSGNLMLWQFAAQEDTLRPFYTLQAHSKQTLDFTFLNSGSLLATAGISNTPTTNSLKKDVCLWDVLLPPNKSLINSFTADQENGASSIVYSPKNQTIIVGGKKGSIALYDIRTNKTLDSFKAHSLNTKTLTLDPSEDFVISGSSDGNIKSWSLPSLTVMETFEDAHKKQTFLRPTGVFKSPVSTYGVIQCRIAYQSLYSVGADGRLVKRSFIRK